LADIGGTNVRFAIAEAAGAAPSRVTVLRTADYPNLATAAAAYLADLGRDRTAPPAGAALAIAAPITEVRSGPIRLTNSAFTIDAAALGKRLGLQALWLVNDFE